MEKEKSINIEKEQEEMFSIIVSISDEEVDRVFKEVCDKLGWVPKEQVTLIQEGENKWNLPFPDRYKKKLWAVLKSKHININEENGNLLGEDYQ